MKKLLCLLLLCTLSIVACGSSTPEIKKQNDTSSDNSKKEDAGSRQTTKEKVVNQSVEKDGIKIIVNSMREENGFETVKPKDGKVFLILKITVDNSTDADFSSSTLLNYELSDADGVKQDLTLVANLKSYLDVVVAPKSSETGEIAFEVTPETIYTLTFKPNMMDGVSLQLK